MPRINYNAPAMVTVNRMTQIDKGIYKSLEKISSGMRINRSADDVPGHNTSEQLRAQIRGLNIGARNIQDGIALINVAEGALNEVASMLQRLRELSVQAATDTVTQQDRFFIEAEVNKLKEEIDFTIENTQYNGQSLLNGKYPWGTHPGGIFHIGPNNDSNTDYLQHTIQTANTVALGIDGNNMRVNTIENASDALAVLDRAINIVSSIRTDLGAVSNRLEHAWTNQSLQEQNMQAYESVIRDTDFAYEMTLFTRDKILKEYSTAMLSQANMAPQSVMKMLD